MATLCLDLGWNCGWCLWRAGDEVTSGEWKLDRESPDDDVRLLAFRQKLSAVRAELDKAGERLDSVAYESVDFRVPTNGVYAEQVWGALWGNLLSWCRYHKIDARGVNVSTIKKHVTGHGSAAKPLVTKRVKELFPHVRGHNEADAVALLLTARNKFPAEGVR